MQVKGFLACSEKCVSSIGKGKEFQHFSVEILQQTSRSNFGLSGPECFECLTAMLKVEPG